MPKKKRPAPLSESGYDLFPEEKDTIAEYLGFLTNGLTDNEKIDDCDYYDDFLGEGEKRG